VSDLGAGPTHALHPIDAAALAATGLSRADVRYAGAQRLLCRVLQIPLYAICVGMMRFHGRYVIEDLAEIRRAFKEHAADRSAPLLVCANHLTFIDSAVMIWAFGSQAYYLTNFSRFSWNLPAGDFFKKKLFHRFMALIAKCVFIHRDGSKAHKDSVMQLTRHLLEAGEVVTVFPEGKRSRTGRFDPDALTYGVGKLVSEMGRCRVLCAYLRSDKQDNYTNYPPKGSRFHLEMELLELTRRAPGREGYAEIVGRIGRSIKRMEDAYFARKTSG
jgi:hypothetical protein